MIHFTSFSDRDFREVSLAFLKATIVAVSPALGTGDVERLIGEGTRSSRKGSLLTTAGSYDDEGFAIFDSKFKKRS